MKDFYGIELNIDDIVTHTDENNEILNSKIVDIKTDDGNEFLTVYNPFMDEYYQLEIVDIVIRSMQNND